MWPYIWLPNFLVRLYITGYKIVIRDHIIRASLVHYKYKNIIADTYLWPLKTHVISCCSIHFSLIGHCLFAPPSGEGYIIIISKENMIFYLWWWLHGHIPKVTTTWFPFLVLEVHLPNKYVETNNFSKVGLQNPKLHSLHFMVTLWTTRPTLLHQMHWTCFLIGIISLVCSV